MASMLTLLFTKINIFFAAGCATHTFFFLPPWYEYLKLAPDAAGSCTPVFNFPNDIWAIGLGVLDMLLRLGGFVAVISIIYAGIEYMTTLGNSEKGVAARKRIVNSLIGLAIVIFATGVVAFVGNSLK